MRTFLTAEWRHLLMLNYVIDPELLLPFLPRGVELDTWNGRTYVSLVGFHFLRTRVCGVPIPLHSNFEEVNLRFYVRRHVGGELRRGVVFIKEIVPRWAIATVARVFYNEPYVALPMRHRIDLKHEQLFDESTVKYEWFHGERWNSLGATVDGTARTIIEGSEEEFITEHYWGYTAQKDNHCNEYAVEHPRWKVFSAKNVSLHCDVAALYDAGFVKPLSSLPLSAFVAEGSSVSVKTACNVA